MLRGLLTWGLLGFALGAYYMSHADDRTQYMVRQRSRQLGRRVQRMVRSWQPQRSPARRAVESTLQMLRVR